jgi:hypothetical protein
MRDASTLRITPVTSRRSCRSGCWGRVYPSVAPACARICARSAEVVQSPGSSKVRTRPSRVVQPGRTSAFGALNRGSNPRPGALFWCGTPAGRPAGASESGPAARGPRVGHCRPNQGGSARPQASLLVSVRSWHALVTPDIPPRCLVPPLHTAWMPRSCSSSDMVAATMQYAPVTDGATAAGGLLASRAPRVPGSSRPGCAASRRQHHLAIAARADHRGPGGPLGRCVIVS